MANRKRVSALSGRQLILRRDAIGGSEIAVLAGLSKWSSPIEVWEAKVLAREKEQTDAMEFGVFFEEPIAKIYAHRFERWLKPVDTLKNPRWPFLCATPDRAVFVGPVKELAKRQLLKLEDLAAAEKMLEIKSTTWRQAYEWGEPGTDQIPTEYIPQTTLEMGLSGHLLCDVGVMVDRDSFERYTVHFKIELMEALNEIGERFIREHVNTGIPPPPDASDKYAEFLGRAYPHAIGDKKTPLIQASPQMVELVLLWAKVREAEKKIGDLEGKVANSLRSIIGPHRGLQSKQFGKVYWSDVADQQGIDWQELGREAMLVAGLVLQGELSEEQRAQLSLQVKTLEQRHQKTLKAGHRRLAPYFTKELKDQTAEQIGGSLEALWQLALNAANEVAPDESNAVDPAVEVQP
jgi:putative phage-type endonuclease